MTKTELDPLRVILGVVAHHRDSDLLLNVALAAGLRFDAALSDRGSYSQKNRVRELLPRILAAYDALSEHAALGAANALVAALSAHGEVFEKASNALERAGWTIRDGELIVTDPDIREMFFPKGSQWDAFVVLKDIFHEASARLTLVDPYLDGRAFELLSTRATKPLSVRILCSKSASAVAAEAKAFMAQHSGWNIEVRQAKDFHDRFVVVDDTSCIHIGASINGAGKTAFMISPVEDQQNQRRLLDAIEESWLAASPLT